MLLAACAPGGGQPADSDAPDTAVIADPCENPDPDADGCLTVAARHCPGLGGPSGCFDCDEANPAINEEAREVCGNAVDEDCDGELDDPIGWYADEDGDGYGTDPREESCEVPLHAASHPGDCDDADVTVSPAAFEVWGNGADEDCTGADGVAGASNVVEGLGQRVPGGGNALGMGAALAAADLDGDGVSELAVGGQGVVAVTPFPVLVASLDEAPTLLFSEASPGVGTLLAAGDSDGNGRDELIVPAVGEATFVWVLEASVAGEHSIDDVGHALSLVGGVPLSSVAGGQDLDGDGLDDLLTFGFVMEPPYTEKFWTYYPWQAQLRVVPGPLSEASYVLDGPGLDASSADEEWSHYAAAAAGDLNGDGYADFTITSGYGVYLYAGPVGNDYDAESYAELGLWDARVHGVGDLDGDERDDLVVSGSVREGPIVFVQSGPVSGRLWEADYASFALPKIADAATFVADRGGDGVFDLFVGMIDESAEGRWGAVFPLALAMTGTGAATDQGAWYGPTAPSSFGSSLLVLDATGDGAPELVVGAPREGTSGAVYVLPIP
ncbi:MAG: MopE-related protein [Myxococcota bacterium]